ncbi:MAG: SRPBCC family protein [Planctomycetes bacterium]|nr:SRPBCC family protein [Planctomycetota bacterium]
MSPVRVRVRAVLRDLALSASLALASVPTLAHAGEAPETAKTDHAAAVAANAKGEDPFMAELGRGETVIRTWNVPAKPGKEGFSIAVIDAERERVWRVVTDYRNFAKFMRNVKKSEVIRDGPVVLYHRAHIDILRLGEFRYTNKVVHDKASWRITWTYEPGKYDGPPDNIGDNSGSWELQVFAGDARKTRLTYRLYTDPGIPVPKPLQTLIIAPTLRGVMEDVKNRVNDPSYNAPPAETPAISAPTGADDAPASAGTLAGGASQGKPSPAPAASDPPRVEGIAPASPSPGDMLIIRGTGFGGDGAEVAVTLGDRPLPIASRTPARIVVELPAGAASGDLRVRVDGQESLPRPVAVQRADAR